MPQPTEPRNRKVAVLARDASGAPVFVTKVIVATDTQVAQGDHYDRAIEQVRAERYEPKFAFDETDVAARQLADLAGWFYGCGTPLSFEYLGSKRIDLSVGSLDEPQRVHPVSHFAVETRIAEWHAEDGLPGERLDEHQKLVDRWKQAYGDDVEPGIAATRKD